MKTPDLTPAQMLAVVKNVIAVAVAFGAPLTSSERVSLIALAGSLGVVLIAADAAIRRGRAQHLAGPIADLKAAQAISEATAAVKPKRTADLIESEAAAEAVANAQNAENAAVYDWQGDGPHVGGLDPAAPTS